MRAARSLVVAFWLIAACGSGAAHNPDDGGPARIDAAVDAPIDAGGAVDAGPDAAGAGYVRQPPVTIPPEPPALDVSHHPVDDHGRPILGANGNYHLVERAPDPLTALSSCTAMIVRCVDPAVRGRSLDACAISPPRCATAQPWLEPACCATTCVDRYEALRTAGTEPITAFREAFYGRPSCAPGAEALLGGAP